jgi:extracellular elastinolytic metalloproteinase
MTREIDKRDFSVNRTTSAKMGQLKQRASTISDRLPEEHRIEIKKFDATTANPSLITSENAPAEKGNYVQRALDHLRNIGPVLGLEPTQPAEFIPDPTINQTSSGNVAVNFLQQYKGIPIFEAAQMVRFSPNGRLDDVAGSSITISKDMTVSSKLTVQDAVMKAAKLVAEPTQAEQEATDQFGEPFKFKKVDLTNFTPKIIATIHNKPDLPTVLESGPFGDKIRANLIWFPLNNDDIRLSWEIILTMPNAEGIYRTIVDAANGDILYSHQIMNYLTGRGRVFAVDGGTNRQLLNFPIPLGSYGLPNPQPPRDPLPQGFPDNWISSNNTFGNCVHAHLGYTGPPMTGTTSDDDTVSFDPQDQFDDDQKVLNIFYYNCFMHDFAYQLGFDENHFNFQQDNFGRGGIPNNPVNAQSHPGPVTGTANMSTPPAGTSPTMNMGLVTETNRHTAFDSSVVFHEYTHGITNRLIAGGNNTTALESIQSGGMGEGWSDYIACTINKSTVVGAWVVNDPRGIRGFPYDDNFPDNFGNLGTGRYTEVHNIGEIWCATLLEMSRNIDTIRPRLGVQLVIDGVKLTRDNPSFLDARDGIFLALSGMRDSNQLTVEQYSSVWTLIWKVFAKYGMGPNAQSNGAQLSGIIADLNAPSSGP